MFVCFQSSFPAGPISSSRLESLQSCSHGLHRISHSTGQVVGIQFFQSKIVLIPSGSPPDSFPNYNFMPCQALSAQDLSGNLERFVLSLFHLFPHVVNSWWVKNVHLIPLQISGTWHIKVLRIKRYMEKHICRAEPEILMLVKYAEC